MVNVKKYGKLLTPTELSFENRAVLNPAIYQEGGQVHLIYRAIDLNYISCLGYARLDEPTKITERWTKPFMYPKYKNECKGLEDPRLVKIDDEFYLTYVIHDGKNAITALATGDSLFSLKKKQIVSPKIPYKEAGNIFRYSKLKDDYYFFESFYQEYGGNNVLIWHKDCVPFPEKINGQFAMLHRILPDIQIIYFEEFDQLADKYFWINYLFNLSQNVVLEGEQGFESRHLGGGCAPIKTKDGWLLIYHGVQEFNCKRVYHAGAALLDLENPQKVIARLPYPLFSPTEDYELTGTVNNVVFPTGTALFDDQLYIYYGAADTIISVASVSLTELLNELAKNRR